MSAAGAKTPSGLLTSAPVRGRAAWRDNPGRLALVLVVVHLAWRAIALSSAYFTQDDFLMLSRSVGQPITGPFLTQNYSGHVFPGGFLMAWVVANPGRMSWEAAVWPVLVGLALVSVMAWLVLSRLMGQSWWRLPLFVFFLACPLTIWSIQWWAVAIQFVPVTLFSLLAVWAFLVLVQDGRRWAGPAVVAFVLAGLMFQERGVLAPMVLGLVAVAASPARGWRRVGDALRAHAWLWLTLGLVLGAYLVAHRRLAPIVTDFTSDAGDGAEFVGNLVLRNALVGLWGGPWGMGTVETDSIVVPSVVAVVVTVVATVLFLAVSLRSSRAAGRPVGLVWVLFAVLALLNFALLFAGRSQLGAVFGLNPRYSADLVLPATVVLALVVGARSGHTGHEHARRGPRVPIRAVTLGVAYALCAALTTVMVLPATLNEDDKAYVDAVRRDVRAHPERVLFDVLVPDNVMIGWFGDDARLSTVLRAAPEKPVFDVPATRLYMADPRGEVHEVALVGTSVAEPAPDPDDPCGYHVMRDEVEVELERALDGGRHVLRIGYYSGQVDTVTVRVGEQQQSFRAAAGLGSVDLVVDGPVEAVHLGLSGPGTVCVPSLVVGSPVPLGS